MTPAEFKAWFDGFTEAMDGMPTEAQWAKVKERVAQIDGAPTTYPVYVERYWPRPYRWISQPTWMSKGTARYLEDAAYQRYGDESQFDSSAALYATGKADFQDLTA